MAEGGRYGQLTVTGNNGETRDIIAKKAGLGPFGPLERFDRIETDLPYQPKLIWVVARRS